MILTVGKKPQFRLNEMGWDTPTMKCSIKNKTERTCFCDLSFSSVKVDFFSISYRQLEKLVSLSTPGNAYRSPLKISLASINRNRVIQRGSFNVVLCLQVADDVNVAMERVCGNLEQESFRFTQTMGETLFELYMSLKSLKRFREYLPLKLVIGLPFIHLHEC